MTPSTLTGALVVKEVEEQEERGAGVGVGRKAIFKGPWLLLKEAERFTGWQSERSALRLPTAPASDRLRSDCSCFRPPYCVDTARVSERLSLTPPESRCVHTARPVTMTILLIF